MSRYTPPTPYPRTATVLRVVDGDTLHVAADVGLDLTVNLTLRLYGVDAPEMSTAEGRDAKRFVESWVADHGPRFELLTVKDRREKYGRYLADLVPLSDGTFAPASLCLDLVTFGHATVYLP